MRTVKLSGSATKKLDKSLKQIQKYPDGCQQTDFVKGLHKLVDTKQTSIFYLFDSKTISVVTIFDNRMNPEKLKKENRLVIPTTP